MISRRARVARQFAAEVAVGTWEILHDSGENRHIRFTAPLVEYEIVTWNRHLLVRSGPHTCVFHTGEDQFQMFRPPAGNTVASKIWPDGWARTLSKGRNRMRGYSAEATVALLWAEVRTEYRRVGIAARGLAKSVMRRVVDPILSCPDNEAFALDVIHSYRYGSWIKFRFLEPDESIGYDYATWYLWLCYALARGIERYDAGRVAR